MSFRKDLLCFWSEWPQGFALFSHLAVLLVCPEVPLKSQLPCQACTFGEKLMHTCPLGPVNSWLIVFTSRAFMFTQDVTFRFDVLSASDVDGLAS